MFTSLDILVLLPPSTIDLLVLGPPPPRPTRTALPPARTGPPNLSEKKIGLPQNEKIYGGGRRTVTHLNHVNFFIFWVNHLPKKIAILSNLFSSRFFLVKYTDQKVRSESFSSLRDELFLPEENDRILAHIKATAIDNQKCASLDTLISPVIEFSELISSIAFKLLDQT